MNESEQTVVVEHGATETSLRNYIIGFVASVGITLVAYLLATHHVFAKNPLTAWLTLLAIIQFIVQMVFFLHISAERKPRWKLAVMCFMLSVVLILVFGSLWIMNNLNYRMTPQQIQQYMKSQDSL